MYSLIYIANKTLLYPIVARTEEMKRELQIGLRKAEDLYTKADQTWIWSGFINYEISGKVFEAISIFFIEKGQSTGKCLH